jgi:hypothetical protein
LGVTNGFARILPEPRRLVPAYGIMVGRRSLRDLVPPYNYERGPHTLSSAPAASLTISVSGAP